MPLTHLLPLVPSLTFDVRWVRIFKLKVTPEKKQVLLTITTQNKKMKSCEMATAELVPLLIGRFGQCCCDLLFVMYSSLLTGM
jgi:hypothetical protein